MLDLRSNQPAAWPEDVVQLLDEHHLVAVSSGHEARAAFSSTLAQRLAAMADTEVFQVSGRDTATLPAFCLELSRQTKRNRTLRRTRRSGRDVNPAWWHDRSTLRQLLRRAGGNAKRSYLIWHDADVMLHADPAVFSAVVNTLLAVAAEREHVSDDRLLLQRVAFIGSESLAAYAADPASQFQCWLDDEDDADSPTWEVASVLARPRVLPLRIDDRGATAQV